MKVRLLVVQGQPQGKYLTFSPGDYYIGRGDECQVRPNSALVSRQHCLIRVRDDAVFVRDLGSRNGTLVNGVLIDGERPLQTGDQIQIGPLVFEMRLEEPTGLVPGTLEEGAVATADTMVEIGAENEPQAPSTADTGDSHPPFKP